MRIQPHGMYNEYLTCLDSVLITILKSAGLQDEASLMGQRGSFFVVPEEGLAISPRIPDVEQKWAEHLEIVHHSVETATELDEGIARSLERGLPVCLPVDLYSWPHTPHFKQRHQHHYVAVFGLEEAGYHVVCPYYGFEGSVSRQQAHEGYFSPGSGRTGLLTLENPVLSPPSAPEVEALARASCAFMLGAAVPESLADVDPRLLGCAGIATFADRLETLIETHGDHLPKIDGLADLSRHLMAVGYSRHWFFRLLSAQEKHLLPDEDGVRRRWSEVTQAWIAVGKRLAMGLYGRRVALISQSLRRVAQLVELESDLFTAMREALDGQGEEAVFPPSPHQEAGQPALWPDRAPFVAPRAPEEEQLAAAFAEILGRHDIGRDDHFFQLGGNSILLIRLSARIREDFGVDVEFHTFFEAPTVAQLAARLRGELFQTETIALQAAVRVTPEAPPDVALELRSDRGPFPLAPSQQGCFVRAFAYHHWNISRFFELGRELRDGVLVSALDALLRHHAALRARFEHRDGQWLQISEPPGPVPLTIVDLRALAVPRHRRAMEAAAAELQTCFDLSRAPLLRFVHFARGPRQRDRLFILFHHLLLDGYSCDLVYNDLRCACEQVERGEAIRLPPEVTSFRTWVERLSVHAGSPEMTAELNEWLAQPWSRVASLPVDHLQGGDLQGTTATVSWSWDTTSSRRLTNQVAPALGVTVEEILIAGLARALADWSGHAVQAVKTFCHGRLPYLDPELDVSRTVGFFSYTYPIVLELAPDADPLTDLEHAVAQVRRVPNGGLGYALLRLSSPRPWVREAVKRLPTVQATLNYRGDVSQGSVGQGSVGQGSVDQGKSGRRPLLQFSDEDPGPRMPLSHPRSTLIRLLGRISGDRLHLVWEYGRNRHERSTIEGLAARLDGFLQALVG